MKTTKLLALIFLSLSVLVLSACAPKEKKEEQPETKKEEISADTILDNQILEQAAKLKSLTECEKILTESKKDECKKVVNSLLLTDQAVADASKSTCQKIELARYKENCENLVNQVIIEKEKAEKAAQTAKELLERRETLGLKAVEKHDITLCDQIGDKNFREECIFNVLTDPSYTEVDKSACEILKSEILKKYCLQDPKWS